MLSRTSSTNGPSPNINFEMYTNVDNVVINERSLFENMCIQSQLFPGNVNVVL